jgi:hypothetical protein
MGAGIQKKRADRLLDGRTWDAGRRKSQSLTVNLPSAVGGNWHSDFSSGWLLVQRAMPTSIPKRGAASSVRNYRHSVGREAENA